MVRLAWLTASAVLALGSVAMAQPGLIVDPWGSSHARAEAGGRFRVTQRAHSFEGTGALIVDPWRVSSPAFENPAGAPARSLTDRGATAWTTAAEIVDPWASSRGRAASVPLDALIVDPWAR